MRIGNPHEHLKSPSHQDASTLLLISTFMQRLFLFFYISLSLQRHLNESGCTSGLSY